MKHLKRFNESSSNMNIRIFQYVSASDFAEWVSIQFGGSKYKIYDRLLDNDYIEGGLGSRWGLDYATKEGDKGNEIAKWYAEFLMAYDLKEIELKYGG